MKLRILGAAVVCSLSSGLVLASPYQSEISATYRGTDFDDTLRLEGEWHFNAVNTGRHPLAEAAFLERSSNVGLTYAYTDPDLGGSFNTVSVDLEYFVPNSIFYLGAGYEDEDGNNDWSVTLGVLPMPGLLITTTYEDEAGYDLNLAARYFTELAAGTALSLRARYEDHDASDLIGLEADYYLDRTLSVGVELEDQDDTGYGVRTRKFFTPVFSGEARYFNQNSNDLWEIGVSYRF